MGNRITESNLRAVIARINRETGSPDEAYTRLPDGTLRANVGNYHLDSAYGGVTLARMCNEHGGITHPLGGGYCTKHELYDQLFAFIGGLDADKKVSE